MVGGGRGTAGGTTNGEEKVEALVACNGLGIVCVAFDISGVMKSMNTPLPVGSQLFCQVVS